MAWLVEKLRASVFDVGYVAILIIAAPWLAWRSLRTGRYREGWAEKLLGTVPRRASSVGCVWMHAVSVGEVNLLGPLIAEWARRRPDWDIVVSTTTQTGYQLATKKYPERTVCYCPLDVSWAVRRAVARVRPDLLMLAELELWPNLIAAVRAAGGRVAVVNGRLGDRSFRGYRRFRWVLAPTLARLDLVAAQSEETRRRFVALGVPESRALATGSIKFDGARTDRHNPATLALARLAGVGPEDVVLLAGSTQEPEETLAVEAFRRLAPEHPRLRLILVPRHPERFDAVARMLDQSGLAWRRRSRLESDGDDSPNPDARILLVDRVGELGAWWGLAQIGFVGGSLGPRGGQNMIEPAAYGVAVSFGPRTHNFRDVVAALLAADAAVVVADGEALTAFVRRALEDPCYAHALGERAKRVVLANQGATARTVDALDALLDAPQTALSRAA